MGTIGFNDDIGDTPSLGCAFIYPFDRVNRLVFPLGGLMCCGTASYKQRAGRQYKCDGFFHGVILFDARFRPNDSAHRWRPIRNFRITTWRCGATIRCSAGFGRIPVLGLPGSELKDALPCQPRSRSRSQHAGDDHPAYTGRHHNDEVSNLHSAYEFLNTAASIHHPSSGAGSLPRLRSRFQHLPNAAPEPRGKWRGNKQEALTASAPDAC